MSYKLGNMRKKNKENKKYFSSKISKFFLHVLPLLKEFLPIFFDKLAEIQGKPTIFSLKKENEELRENLTLLEKKVHWIFFFLIIQSIFLLVFIIYLSFVK